MVSPVHHATLAKANKSGITVTGGHNDSAYTIIWAERNKRFLHSSATQGLADMLVLKLMTLEYPELVASYFPEEFVWNVAQKKKGHKIATLLASAAVLEDAFDLAIAELADEKKPKRAKAAGDDEEFEDEDPDEEFEDEDLDEETESEGKSVVKKKYKTIYRPHHATNGDDLVALIAEHVKEPGDDGRSVVSRKKLQSFAIANGCWDDRYAKLNTGLARMSVGNKLRAKVRKGHVIVW